MRIAGTPTRARHERAMFRQISDCFVIVWRCGLPRGRLDAEIGRHQQMHWRMICPVRVIEFLKIQKRQLVDGVLAVSAGGGKETVDV